MRVVMGWALAAVVCMGLMVGCDQKKEEMSTAPEEKAPPPMFPEESVPKVEPAPVAPAPAPVDNMAAEPAPAPKPAPKESYAAPKKTPKTYVVQKGDTLQKISDKFYGTTKNFKKIYEANKGVIKDMNKLKVGTKIKIPD